MERINDGSLSPTTTTWTKSTSAEKSQGALFSTSVLTITDLLHDGGRSVAGGQFKMNSSQTSVYMESVKTDTSTSSLDDLIVTADHLQSETLVETSPRELRPSSAQNVVTPIAAVGGSMFETTAKRETEDFSLPLTLTNITPTTTAITTTAVPLRGDNVMYFVQPKDISQTHVSEKAQKILVLRNVTAARDSGHVSTSYEPTDSLQFSNASQSSTLQKSSTVTATEISHSQSSSPRSRLRSRHSSVQETTSQSSISSSMEHMEEYTSAIFHNGYQANGTSAVMKVPVSSDNSVAFMSVVTVGILLGILMVFVMAVSLIVILRRRRKTDNLQTSYACVQKDKSILPSKMCSVGVDYTHVTRPPPQPGSVDKPDEVLLLPNEHSVHKTSVDSTVACSVGDVSFEELDHLVHIDTDMSSLLQVMDSQLVQNSHRSDTSDDVAGSSWVDVDQVDVDFAAVSEDECHPADCICCSVDDTFHLYDPVYVPHNDAAAMARRVDNETSYVRTLQSRHNFSPYEEVCYGVRPLLLSSRPTAQVHHQPFVPPRTSSVTDSHLANSGNSSRVVEHIDGGQTHGTNPHGELSHQTSTVSDVDAADTPSESRY